MWCVLSGPDESHLHDVAWFSRLKDAKYYADILPVTPAGNVRPYKIERHLRGQVRDVFYLLPRYER